MSRARLGRVIGGRIELLEPADDLEGKLVRCELELAEEEAVAVELVELESYLNDPSTTNEDRASIERGRNGPFISSDEMRRRLDAHRSRAR